MAQQRRSPYRHRQASLCSNSPVGRRKYSLRHPTSASAPKSASSHASVASSSTDRAVLVPLHLNLRRLPSRLRLLARDGMYRAETFAAQVGAKRKRVPSGNENGHAHGRPTRGAGKMKRQRSTRSDVTTDEEAASSMDVDFAGQWSGSDPEGEEDDEWKPEGDNYLIHEASERELLRLRKEELVRLYAEAGLSEDAESLTKQEIVHAIIEARDDTAELPPSSPPGRGDGNSSDYSSEDGNVAGDEENELRNRYPARASALRRRVTVHELGVVSKQMPNARSLSMGQLGVAEAKKAPKIAGGSRSPVAQNPSFLTRRRNAHANSSRSPTTSTASASLPSPPLTRLRTRQVSGSSTTSSLKSSASRRGKARQVDFNEDVRVYSSRESSQEADEESELTDLTELEDSQQMATPRPSRGRAVKGKGRAVKDDETVDELGRRKTPMRKAKGRVGSLKESDTEEEDKLLDEGNGEEEEVDELVSSPSPTPPPLGRRTPLRRRLRPRRTLTQTATPPSEGDQAIIDEEGEEGDAEDGEEEEEQEEGDEGEVDEGDETAVEVTPKRLRSGKIVGDEDMDDAHAEDDEGDNSDDQEVEEEVEDADAEGEEEDEPMEEEIDLTAATAKTLVRLRRDDLVRMCESRDLDVQGTKPQLAESLLHWRDHQTLSPSSAGTARPPSTVRPGRRMKTRSGSPPQTPILLRRSHFHTDEPRTPPLSQQVNCKETEPELELDLESLGLEEREIPADKLTKLDKIGSGGFKDVFTGKYKGRRVAIAEFRGQLTAMDIKELKLLGLFDHPNIVRFFGVSIPENTRDTPVMIVTELCSNGDLFDYIRNVQPPSLYKVLGMMLDIARGIEYLHLRKPSVIHRDCKSSNILITSQGKAKIADFGLAKVKQSTRSMMRSLVGTVNWQAPELWSPHPKYNLKVDVFSCGMVFWEILQWHLPNKKFPWEGMNEHAIYDLVGAKGQRPSVSGLAKRWCPEIVALIERMWAQDHKDRPTMSEVVQELEELVQQYR
ncbi:hypothetical protein PUNSTDRAFT_104507 [Punctularia strigosozonata HHB-11173 SS5]|uniref:uncharacterized protein n=1 Tax=Punctularia strigosozonata (strain HHB-11173) TaxID=741275 RepID=UPI0004416811|nr:uncharacterized protein PUNSTDRAFT_104507 [Punctularia strigosozonata HHB-11173 SS5]EIN07048.1 hypothetical protein PUNSTDRAFT_104507 [Punctularia strigosozonata HHB-11173 SS5]